MKSSKVLWIITSVLSFSCEVHQCLGFSISPSSSYGVHLKLEDHATNQRRPIRPFLLDDCRHSTATLCATSSAAIPTSAIASTNHWGNIAVLSFAASLAQLLGKTTLVGRLLGAPVTAMALTFVLSSLNIIPSSNSNWLTLLPSGGSQASAFLQTTSLTLATPLLLLGTSIRGKSLQRCGSLLGSFVVASLGTLIGAILAITVPSALQMIPSIRYAPLPNGEGIKIASALLAKNIGGGINYMAVCSCLGVAPESIAAGLCVDNVMALAYFPLTSVLASNLEDVNDDDANDDSNEQEDTIDDDSTSPIESLSHAFTIAAGLTAFGQLANSKLQLLRLGSESLNLSLPITTLLAVLFSTYYPPNWFMSPTKSSQSKSCNGNKNSIAQAGERLGTSLLFLFFATAGAPGWKLKESIQQSFSFIAPFLIIMYSVHLGLLWIFQRLVDSYITRDKQNSYWYKVVASQRLLTASSAAIGGPATAAALAQANKWKSLLTPSLLVGNVGYAIATFIALAFYSAFR